MDTQIQELKDDNLLTPVVGEWGLRKYKLLAYYAELFAVSMKKKWDCRVYLDLFAGAGRARIKHTNRIIPTSSYLALSVSNPFDQYIFCDKDGQKIKALEHRVNRDFAQRNVIYKKGDCNIIAKEIRNSIPRASPHHKVLSFCFVDPFRMETLNFSTIKEISEKYVDFLVLIPAYMDARRNLSKYLNPLNKTVDRFLGMPDWRDLWGKVSKPTTDFGSFIADQFGFQMQSLGYEYSGLQDTVLVKLPIRNVSLYRLAFYSRNPLGHDFWNQARGHTRSQLPLF